jgi:hypothetical protein
MNQEPRIKNQEPRSKNQESRTKNQEARIKKQDLILIYLRFACMNKEQRSRNKDIDNTLFYYLLFTQC